MRSRATSAAVIAGLLGAIAVMAPAGANASTALISGGDLRFFSTAGEANNVTIARTGTDFVIDDSGSTITALSGCTTVTANRVTCPEAPVLGEMEVLVGDLADQVVFAASIPEPPDGIRAEGDSGADTIINLSSHPMRVTGGADADSLVGGSAEDGLVGNAGGDTLVGNGGDDDLQPGDGLDTVSGGEGDDRFDAGSAPDGPDVYSGGPGRDVIRYNSRQAAVSVSLDGVAEDGADGEGDQAAADLEDVEAGRGDDDLTGNGSDNYLGGNGGDDTIISAAGDDEPWGGSGDDIVNAGPGDDEVSGDDGADTLDGGDDDDTFNYEFSDRVPDQIRGGAGIDSYRDGSVLGVKIDLDGVADDGYRDPGEGPAVDNVGADVEDVTSQGSTDDLITGNAEANQIDAAGGNDRVLGLAGADALLGGPGDDTLDGGTGIDTLDAAGGNDRLRSRDGSPDEVDCGSATDTLLADSLDDFTVTCDSASAGAKLITSSAKLKKGKAKLKVTCPALEAINCKVSVSAAKGKKVLAKGSGTVKSGTSSAVTVKLTKAGKKARGRKLKLKVKTTFKDASGASVTTSKSLTLKR